MKYFGITGMQKHQKAYFKIEKKIKTLFKIFGCQVCLITKLKYFSFTSAVRTVLALLLNIMTVLIVFYSAITCTASLAMLVPGGARPHF